MGKHLFRSLYFNEVFINKEAPTKVFSCQFCEIFKNAFFYRETWVEKSKKVVTVLELKTGFLSKNLA